MFHIMKIRFTLRSARKKLNKLYLDSLKVAEILYVGRSFTYLLMKRGDLLIVRIRKALCVLTTALEYFIREKELKKRAAPVFIRRHHR